MTFARRCIAILTLLVVPAVAQQEGGGLRRLVPGDVIWIHVWREPELTARLRIDSTGYVTQPGVGRVRASGLTQTQLAEKFEAALSEIVARPVVHVELVRPAKSVPPLTTPSDRIDL